MKSRAKEESVGGRKEMREEEERILRGSGLEPGDQEQILANTEQYKVISDLQKLGHNLEKHGCPEGGLFLQPQGEKQKDKFCSSLFPLFSLLCSSAASRLLCCARSAPPPPAPPLFTSSLLSCEALSSLLWALCSLLEAGNETFDITLIELEQPVPDTERAGTWRFLLKNLTILIQVKERVDKLFLLPAARLGIDGKTLRQG